MEAAKLGAFLAIALLVILISVAIFGPIALVYLATGAALAAVPELR